MLGGRLKKDGITWRCQHVPGLWGCVSSIINDKNWGLQYFDKEKKKATERIQWMSLFDDNN